MFDRLPPLPVFRTAAEAERCVDKIALSLGFVHRIECAWVSQGRIRALTYRHTRKALELSATISPGAPLENEPVWLTTCSIKSLDSRHSVKTGPRARPAYLEKDVRNLLARMYR